MFKNKNVSLTIVGDREFRLDEDLVYAGKCGDFTVPAGFVTDFASVPATVNWLIPSYGQYTLAAIVHDDLCVKLADYHRTVTAMLATFEDEEAYDRLDQMGWIDREGEGWTPAEGLTNSRDTDAIFRRIMRELEVPFLRRWLMWTGVRWGAMMNPARRKGILRDLPKMLLISVLASPLVVPATLFVGVGLLIDNIFEKLVGRFIK